MPKTLQISQSLRAWMDAFMHRSMREWGRFAKSTGLTMPQFSILMQLHHKGPCGMSEISERFEVTPAAASQLVEKLVQAGYLERTEDPSDRRAKLLKLSPEGAKLVEEGMNQRHRWMEEVVRNLSSDEQKKIIEALEILTHAAQDVDK
jgi:DNA-binding MarR family transcriptional regulator